MAPPRTWFPEKLKCIVCPVEFEQKRPKQRCCSKSCAMRHAIAEHSRNAKWKPTEKTCEHCGSKFIATTRYAIETQRFCSISCGAQEAWDTGTHTRSVDKVEKTCRVCGATMSLNPSLASVRFTCSAKCRGVWQTQSGSHAGDNSGQWSGGSSVYWKQKARERDNYTCQVDGCDVRDEGKRTHAHHKLPRRAGGADDLSNLITLCDHHHQALEQSLYDTFMDRHPDLVAKIVEELYTPG